MQLEEILRTRYSCRAYRGDPVEEETLAAVLEAARLAPTADNRQPFRLYVLPTGVHAEGLRRVYPGAGRRGKEWFLQAPLVVGIAGDPSRGWVRRDGHNLVDVDCAIVMDYLILRAIDLGLGTCWVADFDPAPARELLRLDPGWDPIAFTPLGDPAAPGAPRGRKPIEELVVRL